MQQAFRKFIEDDYVLVVRFVMRMGASLEDAEDAAQQMAEKACRKVKRGGWQQISHPRAWARKVALNDYRAQRRNEIPFSSIMDVAEAGPGHAELIGQARDMIALLQRLDEDCRAVIAFDLDDIPGPEIAVVLGKTQEQVRDLRKKGRRQLSKFLPDAQGGEGQW
ncbi:sigma-70 family RNA polymerase sigma factor [Actinomadura napierensis]|uniref:sigma-70 family RNA polymerase sigma factor n=1 Tax=Actinomadura napierensis TaxID=267854 RepID=UPI0031D38CDE